MSSHESSEPSTVAQDFWPSYDTEIIFDDYGDLRLIVGGDRTYTVCSRALARASTVFAGMLYGGFAESKPLEGQWVVHIPDETPLGFPILLHIIHGNIHKLHNKIYEHLQEKDLMLASSLLCEVAITADKYDIVHIFWPWADFWLSGCRTLYTLRKDYGSEGWLGSLIWAAWVFGDETLLLRQLEQVVYTSYINDKQKQRSRRARRHTPERR